MSINTNINQLLSDIQFDVIAKSYPDKDKARLSYDSITDFGLYFLHGEENPKRLKAAKRVFSLSFDPIWDIVRSKNGEDVDMTSARSRMLSVAQQFVAENEAITKEEEEPCGMVDCDGFKAAKEAFLFHLLDSLTFEGSPEAKAAALSLVSAIDRCYQVVGIADDRTPLEKHEAFEKMWAESSNKTE